MEYGHHFFHSPLKVPTVKIPQLVLVIVFSSRISSLLSSSGDRLPELNLLLTFVSSEMDSIQLGAVFKFARFILQFVGGTHSTYKKEALHGLPVSYLSLKANIISVSQATSPSTVATALPLPTEPLRRTISTSRRS